ncbi:MAG: class I SAM-dependent methyltransferase [Saprospiraceae bacterium]
MEKEFTYIQQNQLAWNQRVDGHFASKFYNVEGFINGETSLNPIELTLLGDVQDKSILHLQCHFGMDTLSLSRLGAKVTGVDFSNLAIEKAWDLVKATQVDARFIQSDIFKLPDHLDEKFDIVFSSYGTIGWLPELKTWAKIIQRYLKPGGTLVFVEFHPTFYMFSDDQKEIEFSYFNRGPLTFTEEESYVGTSLSEPQSYTWWNHSLEDVLQNLMVSGLMIRSFHEYDFSPHNCFQNMVESSTGQFKIKGLEGKLPLVFSIVAENI